MVGTGLALGSHHHAVQYSKKAPMINSKYEKY